MKKCKDCEHLEDLEREYPEDVHHGAILICDTCDAEYHEEFGGNVVTVNEQAHFNHPNLKTLWK